MLPFLPPPEVNLRRKLDTDDGKNQGVRKPINTPNPLSYLKPRMVLSWVKPVSLKPAN